MTGRPAPFKAVLRDILSSDLDQSDREHVTRWADDDRTEEAWSKIRTKVRQRFFADVHEDCHHELEEVLARFFIREILAARHIAEQDYWPDHLKHATEAESLAAFLSPPGLMLGMPKFSHLVPDLKKLAQDLREGASKRMHISRKSHDRPRRVFMRISSTDTMMGFCGQRLDDVVCVLTEIAFPGQETTVDQVRSSRKPTTRGGRSRRG